MSYYGRPGSRWSPSALPGAPTVGLHFVQTRFAALQCLTGMVQKKIFHVKIFRIERIS